MAKKIHVFLGAILAGLAIGMGGAVYLALENKIAGALLFTVGLYTICTQGLFLFTGKVGYAPMQPVGYLLDLVVIAAGNFVGTGLAALMLRASRMAKLAQTAAGLCQVKVADSLISLFLLGIFCGALMFIAVDGYKKTTNPLILFVCVAAFILSGFEHCIADMFYFSLAGAWSVTAAVDVLVILLGNSLGGMLIPLWQKVSPKG